MLQKNTALTEKLPLGPCPMLRKIAFRQTFGDGRTTLILAHRFELIITYWILPEEGATQAVFYLFLQVVLLPALCCQKR